MNVQQFEQKLSSLRTYSSLNPDAIENVGEKLKTSSDWELYRINPIAFAAEIGFDELAVVDVFIHGAKIGIFDFAWNLLCPSCGGVVYSLDSIGSITGELFFCSTCDIEVEADLSNYIEVSFSINPGIAPLELNPYEDHWKYMTYFRSANYQAPKEFDDYFLGEAFKTFKVVKAGDQLKIPFAANPRQLFRLVSRDRNCLLRLKFEAKLSDLPEVVDVDLIESGFSPDTVNIPAGEITIAVHNRLGMDAGLELFSTDVSYVQRLFQKNPPTFKPFLTGKALLNNQAFRDLFHIQTLPSDFRLKVSNVTVLFTDLKGSTELYEKTGDMFAYNLVQDHFDQLKSSTRLNSGAIVKTIGDAVMASFSKPEDGIKAAVDMVAKIKAMNATTKGHEVAIKVGLHSGTALAVTANETLDYFGQTVNLAARVQGLADGGEIWMTEPIYETERIQDILTNNRYRVEKKSALLKGVSSATIVYRWHKAFDTATENPASSPKQKTGPAKTTALGRILNKLIRK